MGFVLSCLSKTPLCFYTLDNLPGSKQEPKKRHLKTCAAAHSDIENHSIHTFTVYLKPHRTDLQPVITECIKLGFEQ